MDTKGYKKDTQNEQNEQKANMVLELLNSNSLQHIKLQVSQLNFLMFFDVLFVAICCLI